MHHILNVFSAVKTSCHFKPMIKELSKTWRFFWCIHNLLNHLRLAILLWCAIILPHLHFLKHFVLFFLHIICLLILNLEHLSRLLLFFSHYFKIFLNFADNILKTCLLLFQYFIQSFNLLLLFEFLFLMVNFFNLVEDFDFNF